MFKGLKSKLEDEAKKIQATVAQYGENLANQVRTSASDAGSERGRSNHPTQIDSNFHNLGTCGVDNSLIDLNEKQSGFKCDTNFSIEDSPNNEERSRRLSNCSIESNSRLSDVMPSPSNFGTFQSDLEFDDQDNCAYSNSEPKLTEVGNRIVKYKLKYREVVMAFREAVIQNKNLRDSLMENHAKSRNRIKLLKGQTNDLLERIKGTGANQQASLEKIKKYQNLLEKCKEEITANRQKISNLIDENKNLSSQIDDISRLNAEWKGKFDRQEENWLQRLVSSEEKASVSIALSKAEIHSNIQTKDQEIENWIEKYHALELLGNETRKKLEAKIVELDDSLKIKTEEVASIHVELSETSFDKHDEKIENLSKQYELRIQNDLAENDEKWSSKIKEIETQMKQGLQENESKNSAVIKEKEGALSELRSNLSDLALENVKLQNELKSARDSVESLETVLKTVKNQLKTCTECEKQSSFTQTCSSNDSFDTKNPSISEDRTKELLEQCEMLSKEIVVIQEKNRQYCEKYDSLDSSLTSIRTSYEEKIKELNDNLKGKDEICLSLEKQIADLKFEADKFSQERASFSKNYMELELRVESHSNVLKQSQTVLKNNLIELSNYVPTVLLENKDLFVFELNRLGDQINSLCEYSKNSDVRQKQLNSDLMEINSTNAQLISKLDSSRLELESIKEQNKSLLDSSNKQIQAMESEIIKLNSKNDRFSLETESLKRELSIVKGELENSQKFHFIELSGHDSTIKSLSQQLKDLKDARDNEISVLDEEIKKSRDALEEVQSEKSSLSIQLKSKNNDIKQLKSIQQKLDGKSSELSDVIKRNSDLVRENDDLKKIADDLRAKILSVERCNNDQINRMKKESEQKIQTCTEALQLEFKNLYHDVNQKDSTISDANDRIFKLELEIRDLKLQQENDKSKTISGSLEMDYDELSSLRKRVTEYELEMERAKNPLKNYPNEYHSMELTKGKEKVRCQNSFSSDQTSFAEPTEAEYLRNVLFRYMTERETLGKEIVTLARVIGTVAKFSPNQLSIVLRREEIRSKRFLEEIIPAAAAAGNLAFRRSNSRRRRLEYNEM